MYERLKAKFAPLRNKRYAHLRRAHPDDGWIDTLDWKNNDYDFYRLCRSIIEHIDSNFRAHWGLRVDQLADEREIRAWFSQDRARFLELIKQKPSFETLGADFF